MDFHLTRMLLLFRCLSLFAVFLMVMKKKTFNLKFICVKWANRWKICWKLTRVLNLSRCTGIQRRDQISAEYPIKESILKSHTSLVFPLLPLKIFIIVIIIVWKKKKKIFYATFVT